MGRAANPENVRMIAEVERRLNALPLEKRNVARECRAVGLNESVYRSWVAKRKEREEEEQSWRYVNGK